MVCFTFVSRELRVNKPNAVRTPMQQSSFVARAHCAKNSRTVTYEGSLQLLEVRNISVRIDSVWMGEIYATPSTSKTLLERPTDSLLAFLEAYSRGVRLSGGLIRFRQNGRLEESGVFPTFSCSKTKKFMWY